MASTHTEGAHANPRSSFEQFLEVAPDAIVGVGPDGRVVLVNPQTEALFGYARGELMGKPVELLVPERFRHVHPLHRDGHPADPRTRPMGTELELFGRRKDGSEFPAEILLCSLDTESGLLAVAAIRDITERRAADWARMYLAAIIDSSEDAIFGKDLNNTIVSWNKGAERLYGYTAEEVIGAPASLLVPPDRTDETEGILEQVAAQHTVEGYETVRLHKDGRRLTMSLTASPILDAAGLVVGAATIARDITDRVAVDREKDALRAQLEESRRLDAKSEKDALEAQLNQLRRLESVGQLAGGIAHDFNNILGVILNCAQFVAEEIEEGSPALEDVEEIRRAAERAAALTRQLLIFSRREVVHPEVLDLNGVLAELDRLLRRVLGEHVQLETEFAPEVSCVEADPGQIEQVLVNLAVNARDAMPNGGRLLIQTAHVELDEETLPELLDDEMFPDLPAGRYVKLTVSDTGIGMDREVAARAFEPFFSTKPRAQGTGLGLTTVYGIVSEAGGSVRIYSEPGIGTTIKVHLPASDAARTPRPSPESQLEPPRGHDETVLLVEDEESMRRLTERILVKAGYAVLSCPRGADALAACQRVDQHIDLLLTDVVMPEMLGPELVAHATAIRPGLKVLFMSGYAQQVAAELAAPAPEEGTYLEKPFTAVTLLGRVRAVLDG